MARRKSSRMRRCVATLILTTSYSEYLEFLVLKKNAYTFHPLATTRTKRTQRHSACADLYHTFCLNSAGSVNLPVGGASRICPKERARGSAGTSNVLVKQTFELQRETFTLKNWGFPFCLSLNVYSPACWNYKIFIKCLLMLSDQQ